ncbi:type II toxin-antitoxin system Phd/YefM family antitoxin [Polymorphum gilvum]|uniref:Antitoxin n=1 Tax=Polymorphum gilvum (strain LMG 25793 / CGMCC 1.9160 / SL003B-26A1) TaxID=991905 RepID=F2IW94_POLGS|nr:type II toxin-antitoxin system prevent-host-death family antitoxin [Polymorphum gilvum]ADZ71478.1 Prevent-host-death family protein [Polymorphum gilvum SL003B-26A1]
MNEHSRPEKASKDGITVSVAEAKARFSELLKRAAAGEEIHVTRHGKPYVRLGPETEDKPKRRRIGAFAQVPLRMSDDFDVLGLEWTEYLK